MASAAAAAMAAEDAEKATLNGDAASTGNGPRLSVGMKEAKDRNPDQCYEMPEGWLGNGTKAALRPDPLAAGNGFVGVAGAPAGGSLPDEPEPAPEGLADSGKEDSGPADPGREKCKALLGAAFVVLFWIILICVVQALKRDYEEPVCPTDEEEEDINVTTTAKEPLLCEPCGSGTNLLPAFGNFELSWDKYFRAPFYLLGLGWSFLGVGIVCDQFMGAIEVITSAQKDIWMEVRPGTRHKFHAKVWNTTVANLTLMALGSSAPEILLSVIEVMGAGYFAGELGPSTIVGSAAFNLLIITAVCVSAIAPGDTRSIAQTDVFAVTATSSILAYIWMLVMLKYITPDLVEKWEAVVTFIMFPVLIIVSFLADKGYLAPIFRCGKRSTAPGAFDAESELVKLENKYGKELPDSTKRALLRMEKAKAAPDVAGKAAIRKNTMSKAAGKGSAAAVTSGDVTKEVSYGFEERNYTVLECAGSVPIKVVASRPSAYAVQMNYCTKEGTAREGVRYQRAEGIVRFQPNQLERTIEVPLIDDDTWQPDEFFTVVLSDFQVLAGSSPRRNRAVTTGTRAATPGAAGEVLVPRLDVDETTVTVLNDDMPGTLSFDSDETYSAEGVIVQIGVVRTHGSCGRIEVHYTTRADSAVDGRDFKHAQGTLVFQDGEVHRTIDVQVLTSSGYDFEGNERFQIVMSDASPGVKFDEKTDGGDSSAICDVIILPKTNMPLYGRCMRYFMNQDQLKENITSWLDQFRCALYCGGSPEEQEGAACKDWFFHLLSLTWKVAFAVVPPPEMFGGWACFCGALGAIGGVTALIGDMANLLGCCLDIPNDITAITLVALGTSLPDTFASMTAAKQDDTADNSVGNVTGSNCVNVFLGLGLPWTIAAFYWDAQGRPKEWNQHTYKGERYDSMYGEKYPEGGFIMPAGSLSFSVTVFTVCAFLCIFLLIFRRFKYGGELGGPWFAQRRDSVIMSSLWFLYVGLSIWESLSA
jgi:solute carrier family 8 (sodium/calcium exchanger)